MSEEQWIAAADVGGSHITVGLMNLNDLTTVGKTERLTVASKGTRDEILDSWYQAFDRLYQQTDTIPTKMAFAMPGPFDYRRGISLIKGVDKYESLYGVDIRDAFATRFGISTENIRFRNDAEAFLHGEVVAAGVAAGERVLGFTLGTGFGSAFSFMGNTRDLNVGLERYKEGIADEYLTTRWLLQAAQREGITVDTVPALADRALCGDKQASRIFNDYATHLAEVVGDKALERAATVIVLGGNIAKAHTLFLPAAHAAMRARGITLHSNIARLGERAALVGAACLFDTYPQTIKQLT